MTVKLDLLNTQVHSNDIYSRNTLTKLQSSHPENILFTLSISTHVHTLLQHFMIVVYEILTSLKHLGECFWRKLQGRQKGDITWPLNPEELPSRVHTGPLQEIYNATYLSI